MINDEYVAAFLAAYVECALWSSIATNDEPMDAAYGPDDISFGSMENMREECAAFIAANRDDLIAYAELGLGAEQAGHDFWLTRNGHGAGFWDRGAGEIGDRLTKDAHVRGQAYLWDGEDGRVYFAA